MGLLLSDGARSSVLFNAASKRPSVGVIVGPKSQKSLLFGSTLVIEAVVAAPVTPRPKFTVPPDFVFPAALVGDDIVGGLWPEASTLPQRAIKCILDGGVVFYGQDPTAIPRALPFLEVQELATFKQVIADRPPKVVHNYPRQLFDAPVLSIVVGKEDISFQEKFLNDFVTVGIDQYGEANFRNINVFSVGFDSTLSVMIYTQHPDVTIFWYEVAKFILQQSRYLLAKLGIDNLILAGRDLFPDPSFTPEFIYMRELLLRFRTRQVFAEEAALIAEVESFVQTNVQTIG